MPTIEKALNALEYLFSDIQAFKERQGQLRDPFDWDDPIPGVEAALDKFLPKL